MVRNGYAMIVAMNASYVSMYIYIYIFRSRQASALRTWRRTGAHQTLRLASFTVEKRWFAKTTWERELEDEEVRFVGCVHQAEQTRGRGEGCPRRCEEDEITTKQSIDGIRVLSLCSSRACLGKIIIVMYKWRRNHNKTIDRWDSAHRNAWLCPGKL